MSVNHSQITTRLSGGAANTNPHVSDGGGRSTEPLSTVDGTFTSVASVDATEVFDNALGGMDGDHDGAYMLFRENGALEVARVDSYRASDGRFLLDRPLVNAVSIGDNYSLFLANDTFDNVTASQCSLGYTDYRGFYWFNEGSTRLATFAMYIIPIDGADSGVTIDIVCRDDNSNLENLGSETNAPDLSLIDVNAKWSAPINYAQGQFEQPNRTGPVNFTFTISQNDDRGYFLRRTIPANTRRRQSVAFLVVGEGIDDQDTGQNRRGAAVIAFDLDGFTPDLTVTHDRSVRVPGGARFTATVRALETGNVVPEVPVGWSLTGPGTLTPNTPAETDENGQHGAVYASPGAEAAVTDSFLTEGVLPANYTLLRDTLDYDGSYIDNLGDMQDAAANTPRWTHDPATLTLRGLLNEPQRSNLQSDSEVPKDATGDYGNTPATVTPGYTGLPLLGVNVTRIESIGHSVGANMGCIPSFPTLSGATAGRKFALSFYLQNNGSVGTQVELEMREEGGVAAQSLFVDNEIRDLPASVSRVEAQGDVVENDRTDISGFMGRAVTTDDYDFVQGFVQIEEIPSGEEAEASSWVRTTSAEATRARDVLTRTGLPRAVYDITIVRDGVADEVLTGVLITGDYVVPTSVHPLRSITFTPANAGEQITVEASV